MKRDYNLLKEVLSIPTVTYNEGKMVDFIVNWLTTNNIPFYKDSNNNIYATKKTDNVDYYPCVVAHTDTVHDIDTINIIEKMLPNEQKVLKESLTAINDDGEQTGIGGDDKCGVYACLELLKELPNLKSAFFVSEETGCHGSRKADPNFFKDVGYCIQFDAPGNSMVTEYCMGVKLFDREDEFFKSCDEILTESFDNRNKYYSHPYTDVYALKTKFDFSCINFAIGYYNYHRKNEYVVIEDVYNGIDTGKKMIEKLGYKKYKKISTEKSRL
jgi:putative aminopeptidase FrvX